MAITFEQYQELAARTASEHDSEHVNYAMGLAGESGELVDGYKKYLFHAHPIDKVYIKKEAGDVLWYVSQLMRIYNITFEDVFGMFKGMNESVEVIKEKGNIKRVTMVSCLNISQASGNVSGFVDAERMNAEGLYNISHLKRNLKIVLVNLHFLILLADLTIEEVAEANIEKLKARYPDGFDTEKSINRIE